MSIAILMTVHNRRETTLRCLQHLADQAYGRGNEDEEEGREEADQPIRWHLYLTDDGCTDGTAKAVKELLQERVTIIQGNGQLYWNRGMHMAWKAAQSASDYDFYLWLNDDTMLHPTAIRHLLECSRMKAHQAIIAGCISSTQPPYVTTYGGRTHKGWISCNGQMQPLRLMHGNAVLIPRYAYHRIGINDPYYRHAFGDYDYALSAKAKGISVFTTSHHIGTCDVSNQHPACFNPRLPINHRFMALYAPTSYYHPVDAFHFDRKHNGLLTALVRYAYLHLSTLIPACWRG